MDQYKNRKMAVGITLVACAYLAFTFALNSSTAREKEAALSSTRQWARLSSFPKTAYGLRVTHGGSMFTREFIVEFKAPAKDVERWLKESPGTKDVKPIAWQDGTLCYKIKPGGGAQFAELTVTKRGTAIMIRTYWS